MSTPRKTPTPPKCAPKEHAARSIVTYAPHYHRVLRYEITELQGDLSDSGATSFSPLLCKGKRISNAELMLDGKEKKGKKIIY
jgi:hypothetical protein